MKKLKKESAKDNQAESLTKNKKPKLLELWRFSFFSSMSLGLWLLLINKGFTPITAEAIKLKGNTNFNQESVLTASGISFPKPLITIDPLIIQRNLTLNLHLRAVKVRKNILPPSLEIEIRERIPIAFASRKALNGVEAGLLDEEGYWIPIKPSTNKGIKGSLLVEGWQASHQKWISTILLNRKFLGSPLKKILLTPNGELSLQTNQFKIVYLGKDTDLIEEQLIVLANLSKNLPKTFENLLGSSLDIRDPSKPELQMPLVKK